MTMFVRVISIGLTLALGGCWGGVYEHPAAQYFQRTDTITLGAGNAKEVNAAVHVIDPWPRRVGDRRIAGHGERMVNVIERYKGRPAAGAGGGGAAAPQQSVQPPQGDITPAGGSTRSTLPF